MSGQNCPRENSNRWEALPLVPLLGQRSARDVDKLAALSEQGVALTSLGDGRGSALAGCVGCPQARPPQLAVHGPAPALGAPAFGGYHPPWPKFPCNARRI